MEDEQNNKHVRCKSGIENEYRNYLAQYVVAHDEPCDELESDEQNDPEQVKLHKDYIAEICAAILQYKDGTTRCRIIQSKMSDRAKSPGDGNNAKSRIQTDDTQRVNQSMLEC